MSKFGYKKFGSKYNKVAYGKKVKAPYVSKSVKQAQSNIATDLIVAKKQLKRIKSTIKEEIRYKDLNQSGVATNTQVFTLMNGMNMGDTDGFRMGTQVRHRKLRFRITLYSVNNTVANVRIIFVWDKQVNATLPQVNNLLMATDPNAFRNNDSIKRFKILYDRTIAISSNNTYPKRLTGAISLRGLVMNCNTSNTGTISDIVTGGMYFTVLSDVTAASGNGPTYDLHTRFWYDK